MAKLHAAGEQHQEPQPAVMERVWKRLMPLLPSAKRTGRPFDSERRLMREALVSMMQTGCGWRGLPRTLPHTTAYGSIVANKANLAPGDLVFFVNTYKKGISHVGISIGGGNVVQAMSPKQGLGVANIYGAYWSAHYYSAIRPR